MTNNYEQIKEIEKLVKEKKKELEELERKKTDLMYSSNESAVVVCEYESPDDYETHVIYYDFGPCSVEWLSRELESVVEHSERKFDEQYYIRVVSFEESRLYYKLSLMDEAEYGLRCAMHCFYKEKNGYDSLEKASAEIVKKREKYIKELGITKDSNSVRFEPGWRLFHHEE